MRPVAIIARSDFVARTQIDAYRTVCHRFCGNAAASDWGCTLAYPYIPKLLAPTPPNALPLHPQAPYPYTQEPLRCRGSWGAPVATASKSSGATVLLPAENRFVATKTTSAEKHICKKHALSARIASVPLK